MATIKKPGEVNASSTTSKKGEKRLSDILMNRINFHIAAEFEASQIYRAMASWCEYKGLFGTAKFMNRHVEEELDHMKKLRQYALDRNCLPDTPAVKQQSSDFKDLVDVLKKSYEHEMYVTSIYEEFATMALKEPCHTTYQFIQWYLKEQVEEEALFKNLLDKVEMMTEQGVGILEIDEEIGKKV
jgi:ferritin